MNKALETMVESSIDIHTEVFNINFDYWTSIMRSLLMSIKVRFQVMGQVA